MSDTATTELRPVKEWTTKDLEEVRLALYDKIQSVRESAASMEAITAALAGGAKIFPFAPGEQGIRAAKDMTKELNRRVEHLQRLIDEVNEEVFG